MKFLQNELCFLESVDAEKQGISFWMSQVSMENYPTYDMSWAASCGELAKHEKWQDVTWGNTL